MIRNKLSKAFEQLECVMEQTGNVYHSNGHYYLYEKENIEKNEPH